MLQHDVYSTFYLKVNHQENINHKFSVYIYENKRRNIAF